MLHTPLISRDINHIPRNIKLIIYDIDNCVAAGSNDDITIAWDELLAEKFGLDIEEATYWRKKHFEDVGCSLTGFARQYGLPMAWVDEVYEVTGAASAARFLARHPADSRLPVLFSRVAKAGKRQGIITQGHPNHYGPIAIGIGLHPHVDAADRIDRTTPPYDKLEEEVWLRILHARGIRPEEAMVLEDTPNNIIHPANIGMHTVAIGNRTSEKSANSVHWRFATAEDALTAFFPED